MKSLKASFAGAYLLLIVIGAIACGSSSDNTVMVPDGNQAPLFLATAPDTADMGDTYVYNIFVADIENGITGLVITVNASDTCGGVLIDNGDGTGNYTFTPLTGGTTCVVGIRVTETGDPASFADQDTTVTIANPSCVVYVDDTAIGLNDGSSWVNAFISIQNGVDAGTASCDVWVAQGTYSTGTTGSVLVMKDDVKVYGGFAGTENTFAQRANLPTILNGKGVSYHVVTGANNALLDGFIISNGKANGTPPENTGAGMYALGKTGMVVSNCTFSNNIASMGAGMFIRDSSMAITNSTFSDNTCGDSGCGVATYTSTLTVSGSTFTGNGAGIGGGAMFLYLSNTVPISDCAFIRNTANIYGGAVFNNQTTVNATNCIFDSNSSIQSAGAVFPANGSPFNAVNCLFKGNSSNMGGVIVDYFNMSNSTFVNNSASMGSIASIMMGAGSISNSIIWSNGSPLFEVDPFSFGTVTVT